MQGHKGFTLIETLVVLVILTIAMTFVTISIDSNQTQDEEIERLRLTLESAAEQAEIRGTPLLVEFMPQGYRFSRFDIQGNWLPIDNEPLLSQRKLSTNIIWKKMKIDGKTVPLRVIFGTHMPSFILEMETSSGAFSLKGLPTGKIELSREPQANS